MPQTECFGNIKSIFKVGMQDTVSLAFYSNWEQSLPPSQTTESEGVETILRYFLYYVWLQGGLPHDVLRFLLLIRPFK